nr:putative ribonuclease H-like domain-containing protein [Tanacetum cinerariifolium]
MSFQKNSQSAEDHETHLRQVLNMLKQEKIYAKLSKCKANIADALSRKTRHDSLLVKSLQMPLEILVWKWEKITMDLIIKLPKTPRQCDVIWVNVNRLTKSEIFLPIKESMSSEALVKLYLREILAEILRGLRRYSFQKAWKARTTLYWFVQNNLQSRKEYVPLADIVADEKLDYVEEPVEILDTMIKKLKRKEILLFKVR